MHFGAAISKGWDPATCKILQGGNLTGTLIWSISLPLISTLEIHVTCALLSLLQGSMYFCLALFKIAHYSSAPLSGGIVYS